MIVDIQISDHEQRILAFFAESETEICVADAENHFPGFGETEVKRLCHRKLLAWTRDVDGFPVKSKPIRLTAEGRDALAAYTYHAKLKKDEARKERWHGFIGGVLSTVTAELAILGIVKLAAYLLHILRT